MAEATPPGPITPHRSSAPLIVFTPEEMQAMRTVLGRIPYDFVAALIPFLDQKMREAQAPHPQEPAALPAQAVHHNGTQEVSP